MNCTSCKKGLLQPSFIDGLFRAHTCNNCGGNWILVEDFVTWKEKNPEHEFEECSEWSEEDTADTTSALLCPITGSIMRKFKVSAKTSHRIDYSNAVGGIWLDSGEWELLKAEGIAGTLNNVLTQSWQNKIREKSSTNNFADIYESKFGEDNYAKVKEIREWLNSQPQKSDLRSYLLAENPYSASE
ncbi:zf-TFIIB domain-containing protein [Glaciecola sp. MH2013]|uniref:TFIIB-type zinc ribbon-containing protein n=1 Tax=Glaciecola sp. MH2013 TaxID=2785524 RepID=UPI00189E7833|nr:zf-TFIIB domain-containing protein [Glaciecola sp. MH2013]MBF7073410.1 zf-TFIIB domain-containing protein [Glaciecola sp. MH2013]